MQGNFSVVLIRCSYQAVVCCSCLTATWRFTSTCSFFQLQTATCSRTITCFCVFSNYTATWRRTSTCLCVLQLLDCYLEAYQHVFDRDEKRLLAQVITNVMHKRPRYDLTSAYFLRCYRLECICLRQQTQLVKNILNTQVRQCFLGNI